MENKPHIWLTIKYKEDSFDIKLSGEDDAIDEIRPIDSGINIVAILDKKVIYAIQEMVNIEVNHKETIEKRINNVSRSTSCNIKN